MRKLFKLVLVSILMLTVLTGCKKKESNEVNGFDVNKNINLLTREEGSGTRGAFVELFGIEMKDESGQKVDYTSEEAVVSNSTSVMMTSVSTDLYAMGYISLGSLNDTIKAVKIDGVEATVDNIKSGTYKIFRPFNVAYKEDLNDLGKDFLNYVMSIDGQKIVSDNGYISLDSDYNYETSNINGKIVISGSSSVTPIMEKLKEAYIKLNPDVTIDLEQSDSTSGMVDASDGTSDIGMASRDLKDSEIEKGLISLTIANDGIAVIVNNDSLVTDLSKEQVKDIFMGNITTYSEIVK